MTKNAYGLQDGIAIAPLMEVGQAWGALGVNGNFLIGSRLGYQITFQEVPALACVNTTEMATKRFVDGYVLINNQAVINANGQAASNGDLDVNWTAFAYKDNNTVSLVGI